MRTLLCFGMLLSFLVVAPAEGVAQGRKKKKGNETAKMVQTTPADYVALGRMPYVKGKVLAVSGATMVFRVEYQVPQSTGKKPTPPKIKINRSNNNNRNRNRNRNRGRNRGRRGGNINPAQIQRELVQIQRIRDPRQRAQRMAALQRKIQQFQQQQARAQMEQMKRIAQERARIAQQVAKQQQKYAKELAKNPGYKMVTMAKEFQLKVSPKVRVAKAALGLEYDEKGNIKKYDAEKLKEMRDEKIPGYKATLAEVLPNTEVVIYLKKNTPETPKGKDGEEKKSEKSDAKAKDILGDILGGKAPTPGTTTTPTAAPTNSPEVIGILIQNQAGAGVNALPGGGIKLN